MNNRSKSGLTSYYAGFLFDFLPINTILSLSKGDRMKFPGIKTLPVVTLFLFLLLSAVALSCSNNNPGSASLSDETFNRADGQSAPSRVAEGFIGSIATTCSEDVVKYGSFLFVADGPAGIKVVDISSKSNPVLAASVRTTYAIRVYVHGNYLYVCDGPAGLKVFDISDPVHPAMTYSVDTEWSTSCAFYENYLYMGDYFDGWKVFDITDPSTPVLVTHMYNVHGRDIAILDNKVLLSDSAYGIVAYQIDDPTAPTWVFSNVDWVGNYEDIVGYNGYAITSRNDEHSRLMVWYVDNLLQAGHASSKMSARFIDGMTSFESNLIVACGEEGIIGYSMLGLPNLWQNFSLDTPGYARRAKTDGSYLYVADMNSVRIYEYNPVGCGS